MPIAACDSLFLFSVFVIHGGTGTFKFTSDSLVHDNSVHYPSPVCGFRRITSQSSSRAFSSDRPPQCASVTYVYNPLYEIVLMDTIVHASHVMQLHTLHALHFIT
jgi:hypothetical protein